MYSCIKYVKYENNYLLNLVLTIIMNIVLNIGLRSIIAQSTYAKWYFSFVRQTIT